MVSIEQLVAEAIDREVVSSRALSGGDFASAHRVELSDGRSVFAKTHHDPPPGFFTTEAAGLGWLASTGAALVPEVLAVSDAPPLLVLEWIDEARFAAPDEAAFGRALAELHSHEWTSFGRTDERTTGSQALPNEPTDSWSTFLAERRLVPLARIARNRRALSESTAQGIESLAARIGEVVPDDEPPRLLHGDLWAGNRVVDGSGRSWLIDPACFGGHREFDLAMMRLFGGFGEEVFASYHETLPLAEGWQQRVSLHQLPPLIVHAIKFGGPYAAAVERALSQH